MTRRRLRLAALLALAALTGACSGGELAGSAIACKASVDCADERVCDFNYCVAPGENTTVVMARIVPPANSDLLTQQIPELGFASGPDWLIRLLEPVAVHGSVTPAGDSFTVNVPGELEVTTPGDIPGLDYRFTTRSLDGVDVDGDGFTLRVLPGRHYTGTFRPDDADLPNHRFVLTPDDIASGEYDVVLPAATDYVTIGGRVRAHDYTPVGGARVVALLADDSAAGITTTEGDHGFFSITLPPGVTSVRIKVSAPAAGTVFPDFTTEPLTPATDLDVEVPALPAGTEPFEAHIQVVSRDNYGLVQFPAGLTVTIAGDLSGGTLRRSATTDSEGVAALTALPGAYECLVTTGTESPWASWHGRLTLTKALATIELTYRTPVFGTVTDASGAPVASGVVHATRRVQRGPYDMLAIAPAPFKVDVVAGQYQLLVDPGVYDLRVVPDAATGAPAMTVRKKQLSGGVPVALDLELPEPALAHLTVARPDGSFMSGVTVELYQPDPETQEPVLLTKGTTNDAGYVDLLIPFSPP